MNWLTARLSEPSTWAGLATIVATVGPVLLPTEWHTITTIVALVAGGAAVVSPEKGTVPPAGK